MLSGSEWGDLLLWEGGFIKCEIARKGKKKCHLGNVEAILLEDGDIITAGADGELVATCFGPVSRPATLTHPSLDGGDGA